MKSHPVHSLGNVLCATLCCVAIASCKKEPEFIPNNQAPDYSGVPTVVVQNYVNRAFIDLIGREPIDVEMDAEVNALESASISIAAREAFIMHLMTGTAPVTGDSSYKHAYYTRQYELYKARCLEGVSDDVIDGFIADAAQAALADSLSGDAQAFNASNSELQKLLNLRSSRIAYREGTIGIAEVMARMVFNAVYDEINMNSFNFVNATFDNLLYRYPTNAEFNAAYTMVEASGSAILFGQSGQSKFDHVQILTNSAECYEGLVRFCYRSLLGRDPSTYEAYSATSTMLVDHDLQRVQRMIMISNEYAGLDP